MCLIITPNNFYLTYNFLHSTIDPTYVRYLLYRLKYFSFIDYSQGMNTYIDQLVQIKNHIQQAHLCDYEELARQHYIRAIVKVNELTTNLNNYLMSLDNVGVQLN